MKTFHAKAGSITLQFDAQVSITRQKSLTGVQEAGDKAFTIKEELSLHMRTVHMSPKEESIVQSSA